MKRWVAMALGAVAVVVGVRVGLWEAHLWVESTGGPLPLDGAVRVLPPSIHPQFALWVCALLGACAAAVVALMALAVDRWPEATYSN